MSVAGTLRVDGQLTANGADGPTGNYSAGGGGAGGSLWLTVGTLTGAGSISASGGQGFKNYGVGAQYTAGGGGGGRIAIEYGANTMTGTITATGASGNQRGGAGTIYRKAAAEPLGEVLIDNGGAGGAYTALTTPSVFNLTIANHGYAYPTAALSVGNLRVASNGVLFHLSGQTGLNLTALGDATVAAGGAISADGAGYGSGSGPGAGSAGDCGFRYMGGGAGHGGLGGATVCGIPGGPSYGSLLQPVTPGSGGGSPGGMGGGTVRMSVAGTLRVDGQLTANGLDGTGDGSSSGGAGGGGAGGSLWLTVGTLAGAGSISANGGQGGHNDRNYYAGGGSGGRLAVEYGTNTLTGTVAATGGTGNVRGGAGTVYRKAAAEPVGEVLIDNGGAGGAYTPLTTPSLFNLTIANHGYAYPTAALLVGNLRVASNGVLLAGQVGLDLTALGDATLETGGAISADGAGYGPESGPGAGTHGDRGFRGVGSGAGHGGFGGSCGSVPGGLIYGDAGRPTTRGSGGGTGDPGTPGGAGGGTVRMSIAGTLRVDGQLTANGLGGGTAGSASGGGSGGSIWLMVSKLTGTGSIRALGGAGSTGDRYTGGGGGGGRVAIYGDMSGFGVGGVYANGGGGDIIGGFGSVITTNTMLPLAVDSFTPTGTLRQAVSSVDVAFNQSVRSETFTPEDVLITVPSGEPPHGDITVTALSGASFRIGFGAQAAVGTYQVQVGPHIENLYGQEMAEAYVGSFAITNPVIAGFVKQANGVALPNVLLSAGGALSTRTGTNGAFALAVPPGWSGTVTPTNGGWAFTPPSLSYVSLTADATNQNFTASLAAPLVLTTTRSANSLQFRWPSALGLEYQLQSATNLPATTWLDEGALFPGTGGVLSTNLPLGPEPAKFYRLQIEN
jgi:hypothetical protein